MWTLNLTHAAVAGDCPTGISSETDRRPGRLLDAQLPTTLRRLCEVKRRYGPTTGSMDLDLDLDLEPHAYSAVGAYARSPWRPGPTACCTG